ncbi:hypothetical protein E4U41_004348 [Claviceps citrina]|nr:hypothetical protein E4U41_004348 [Claviceps citrina]
MATYDPDFCGQSRKTMTTADTSHAPTRKDESPPTMMQHAKCITPALRRPDGPTTSKDPGVMQAAMYFSGVLTGLALLLAPAKSNGSKGRSWTDRPEETDLVLAHDTSHDWTVSYQKAKAMVDKMTLQEKTIMGMHNPPGVLAELIPSNIIQVSLTGGVSVRNGCSGNIAAIPRLGFPGLCLSDAGQGLRATDAVSGFASGLSVGAR